MFLIPGGSQGLEMIREFVSWVQFAQVMLKGDEGSMDATLDPGILEGARVAAVTVNLTFCIYWIPR